MLENETESEDLLCQNSGRRIQAIRKHTTWQPCPETYVTLITCISGIGGFLFGYDTGVISGALPYLRDDILKDYQDEAALNAIEGAIVSVAVLAAGCGTALGGWAADRFGRKPVLICGDFFFLIGSVAMGLAPDYRALIAGRVAAGAGVGLASVTVPMYIAEMSPKDKRASLVTTNILMITTGQFVSYLVDYLCTYLPGTWRVMLGAAAVPAAVQALGMCFLPESPRWLAFKGLAAEAAEVATLLGQDDDMDLSPAALSNEEVQARELVGVTREPSLRDAFTPAVKLELLLGIGLQVLQQMAGINTVMYFTPAILEMAGFRDKRQQLLAAMLPAGTNAAGTLVGLYTIDRFGRRPLMLASLGGVFVSLSLLAFAFSQTDGRFLPIGQSNCTRLAASTCGECIASGCHFCYSGSGLGVHAGACVDSPDMCLDMAEPLAAFSDSCPRVHPWIVLAGLILYIAAFAPGCGPVPWAVNSEIYPVQVRGVAGGAAATANWLTNALVSQTFLLMTAFLGEPGTFAAYAAIVLVGLLWVHVVMPETKGLSLEEIQGVFASKAKRRTLNENVRLF